MVDIHKEEVLRGLENLGRQGERDICIKCKREYTILGWNFYGLCDECFNRWRSTPRFIPVTPSNPYALGTFCVDFTEFMKGD